MCPMRNDPLPCRYCLRGSHHPPPTHTHDLTAHHITHHYTSTLYSNSQALEAQGALTGLMDERGKYIHISEDEMAAVAAFVKKRGRIAIAELAARSGERGGGWRAGARGVPAACSAVGGCGAASCACQCQLAAAGGSSCMRLSSKRVGQRYSNATHPQGTSLTWSRVQHRRAAAAAPVARCSTLTRCWAAARLRRTDSVQPRIRVLYCHSFLSQLQCVNSRRHCGACEGGRLG